MNRSPEYAQGALAALREAKTINLANATAIGVLESPEAAKTLVNLMNLVIDRLSRNTPRWRRTVIKSPIKWAGGKTRVMPQLLKHLPKADCLIEPFVGSGTVFMNTEYRRYVLCDSNRALINFFRVLTSDTERLIDTARMFRDGNNEEQYYKRRALFNSMQWSGQS
jgi:hypothetical protein